MRHRRASAARLLALAALALPGICPAAADPTTTAAAMRPAREMLVTRVSLNSVPKGDLFAQRLANGDFLLRVEDLRTMGFKEPTGSAVSVDGERYLSLRSMAGVRFEFNEDQLTLDITAEPNLLTTQNLQFGQRTRLPADVTDSGSSLFANYALTTTNVGARPSRPGLSGEFGWHSGEYLFSTDATSIVADDTTGRRKLVRLMSSVTRDDREQLRRVVLGDFFTPTRELSLGVNIGGLSVSKLYSLDPTFVQFPMQSVTGNVALPSQLEVYLDGQRVRTDQLKPGGFELNDILSYGGARDVQVVLRDPFGRVQQLSYSFYFSDQALREGLQEYSYNIGALRRRYGLESQHYGPAAFSVFHRYGLTNALTLGFRAEGTRQLLNGGPTATLVLGGAGVASVAVAGSSFAGRHGAATLASYTYTSNAWGVGASVRHDWNQYAALGDPVAISNRNYDATASFTYRLGARGSVALTHSVVRARGGISASAPSATQPFAIIGLQNRRATRLTYSVPLVPGWAALTATLSHVREEVRGSYNEAFVGLNIFLSRDYTASASYRRDHDFGTQSVQLLKTQPLGQGLGFLASEDRATDPAGETLHTRGTVQYNAPAAILRADLDRGRDELGSTRDAYQLSVAGGIAVVGGGLAVGRPITGSFGLVNVGRLQGVGVTLNGQRMGETNANGTLFLPNLTPYTINNISLAADTLPIEYSTPTLTKRFAPGNRSGSVIDFPVSRLRAYIGKLVVRRDGGASPVEYAEASLESRDARQEFQTGRGGEFYLENLQPGTYRGRAVVRGAACVFEVTLPETEEPFAEVGQVACRPEQ